MTQEQKSVLQFADTEISKHRYWVERNARLLVEYTPFTEESWSSRPEETVTLVDQLLFRWMRLQDALAQKALPGLFEVLEQTSPTEVPFIDIVQRLEQLGLLSSAERWAYFRGVRNSLAHDYPDTDKAVILGVNNLLEGLVEFLEMTEKIQEKIQSLV